MFSYRVDTDNLRLGDTVLCAADSCAVKSYGMNGNELMVNTTDTYSGTVMVKGEPFMLVITAVGDWSITLE